jgi:deoxyribodipyrimidine photo-lyase
MKKLKTGVFWFTNDLRLHDNPALMQASLSVGELLRVCVVDYAWRSSSQYSQTNVGQSSDRFLWESLNALGHSPRRIGQR